MILASLDHAGWTTLAEAFGGNPDVFFAPARAGAVREIRAAGARQPVIFGGAIDDPDIVREYQPSFTTARQIPETAADTPLLARGLDPKLDEDSPDCAVFPRDPAAATTLVQQALRFFDAHEISWIISSFRPGRLISDTRYFNGTKLDDGWECGQRLGMAGLGMVLLSHLWRSDPHGLFVVNGDSGGYVVARGARAALYGRILTGRQADSEGRAATRLANVRVQVTDSNGVARLARLL